MACQCDSEDAVCHCIFTAGLNVTLDGHGSASDPIQVNVKSMALEGGSTSTAIVTVAGSGGVTDPYQVRIDVDPTLASTMWGRWYGSRPAYDALPNHDPEVLYVVIP